MKYLIFSDIHSVEKSYKVFKKLIGKIDYDKAVFLGDIAGYEEVSIGILKDIVTLKSFTGVLGNCDKHLIVHSKPEILTYLGTVKRGTLIIDNNFAICHASPDSDKGYMATQTDAEAAFTYLKNINIKILFFGHIHSPKIFCMDNENEVASLAVNPEIILDNDSHYAICPGSIGLSRAQNSQSSFILYDSSLKSIKYYMMNPTH